MSDPRCPKCETPSHKRMRPADRPNDWGDDVHLCQSCGTEFYANYECDGEDWEGWVTKPSEVSAEIHSLILERISVYTAEAETWGHGETGASVVLEKHDGAGYFDPDTAVCKYRDVARFLQELHERNT